jgi:NAD(P)-dependent dehydrogenase (short-subunit alcohol dehydrogenase family)
MQVEGSTALVSGANRGLGLALVASLLDRGAGRVYAASRRPEALAPAVALDPARVIGISLDLNDPSTIGAAAGIATDVNLLINNAAVAAFAPPMEADPEEVQREMSTNFGGTYAMIRAWAPVIGSNGGGAIVNILSMCALASIPSMAGYSASKAAIHSLTQSMRAALRPMGITVHGAYPAGIDTDMLASPDLPSTSAAEVADGVLAGLEQGAEEIFPCPISRGSGPAFFADPKALELAFASFGS